MSSTPTNDSDTFAIGGDLSVHRLGFGAMRITGPDIIGPPEDEATAREVLRRVIDAGVDFVDTADSYGPGVSERLIGETLALEGEDSDTVVATKAGLLRNADGDWLRHGDPDYVRNQVMCSQDRLGVDTIDLYQFHRPDPDTPFEDSVQAFADLKDEGFVDHVGLSNVSVDQLETARDIVEVATVQNYFNVQDRDHEPVLEACEEYGIGFIPYFPIGIGGFDDDACEVLDEVADAHDASRYQIALAWLLAYSDVTIPIPGTSDPEHLVENVAASGIELTDDEMARLTG